MTSYQSSNYYRSHEMESQSRKYKLSSSRQKHNYPQQSLSQDNYEYQENLQQLKAQTQKLKKSLKQSNAKRSSLVKECSEYQRKIQNMEAQIVKLKSKVDEDEIDQQGDRYRLQELKFLNKQLSGQINELRDQNETLMEKVRYCSDVVEKKYDDLEQKTMKRIQQAMKRVKKSIHYLQTLSIKDIQKTKQILVQNLRKANQLLKGKYSQQNNAEHEIEQLMNPLKNIQEQLALKNRELNLTKSENTKLLDQLKKHKRIQNQLLPQYKQSIEGLKKNLAQVRSQLSENQIEKSQIKKKYEEKIKNIEQQYSELLIEYRKNKLQKKIFENKLEELEDQKEEEKERLVGENQMLKKLYQVRKKANLSYELQEDEKNQFQSGKQRKNTNMRRIHQKNREISDDQQNLNGYKSADYENNHKTTKNTYGDEPTQQKKFIKKNNSFKNLRDIRRPHPQTVQNQNSRVNQDKLGSSYHNFQKYRTKDHQGHKNAAKQNFRSRQDVQDQSQPEQQFDEPSGEQQHEYEFAQPDSQYRPQQSSIMSQESLKNQICKIDQEIMEIQRNLTRQLDAYK